MAFESTLADLLETTKRPSVQQLATDLSDLDRERAAEFAETWPQIDPERRVSVAGQLIELVQDNVDLNFDAVFKIALRDDDARARSVALQGLYEYEGRDLIEVLADVLRNDPDRVVRREAAIALGRYALAAELGYLSDNDFAIVHDTLIESTEDEEEDERVRARAIEALGALSGDETQNLIESIYHEDNLWLKVGAVDAMGRSANDVWLPTILQEMTNRAPEMRHAAAFAAGEIGEESALPLLKRLAVEDPDREVQLAAIHAMGEIAGDMARVVLKSVLYEGDDDLQEAVQEALASVTFADDPLRPGEL